MRVHAGHAKPAREGVDQGAAVVAGGHAQPMRGHVAAEIVVLPEEGIAVGADVAIHGEGGAADGAKDAAGVDRHRTNGELEATDQTDDVEQAHAGAVGDAAHFLEVIGRRGGDALADHLEKRFDSRHAESSGDDVLIVPVELSANLPGERLAVLAAALVGGADQLEYRDAGDGGFGDHVVTLPGRVGVGYSIVPAARALTMWSRWTTNSAVISIMELSGGFGL